MNAFEKTPILLKVAIGLFILYILITFNYIGKFTDIDKTELFSVYKHLFMIGINLILLISKNKYVNYIAILWLTLLAHTFVSATLPLLSGGNISVFHLLNSYDFMRSLIFISATTIIICIGLYNHYARKDSASENKENA